MRRDAAGKHRHYAFVHFTERTSALAAVEAAAGDAAPTIDGAALTVGGEQGASGVLLSSQHLLCWLPGVNLCRQNMALCT
jgi:hypothetical protein